MPTDTREATPRPKAVLGQTVIHNGDGYSWGGDWIVTINQTAINFGGDPHLASFVVRAVNHFDEAVEVLRILAAEADEWGDAVPDDHRPVYVEMDHWDARYYGSPSRFTVGNLRRARALLSKLEASHGSA